MDSAAGDMNAVMERLFRRSTKSPSHGTTYGRASRRSPALFATLGLVGLLTAAVLGQTGCSPDTAGNPVGTGGSGPATGGTGLAGTGGSGQSGSGPDAGTGRGGDG